MAPKKNKKIDLKKVADGVRLMLEGIGEDPERDGLKKTPERVADFYRELTEGMWVDATEQIVPLPGDSEVTNQVDRLSSNEMKIAPGPYG